MNNKIIRSVCVFTEKPGKETLQKLASIKSRLEENDFEVQTTRFCTKSKSIIELDKDFGGLVDCVGVGRATFKTAEKLFDEFVNARYVSMNVDLSGDVPAGEHAEFLMKLIKRRPENTFNFAFTFNNTPSSPYFPSAQYERDGFSIGLQPTDLSEKCLSLKQWLNAMQATWNEIYALFALDKDFLGIDSSIAPIFAGKGSLINFVKRLGYTFKQSCLTDIYTQITHYIKTNNPKPVGLCGLMLPCLEDFELADEYEKGNFDLQTNLFLSLHSGLGIDTYPIGINENQKYIVHVMRLTQKLSQKYSKPLSIRFVSDGKAKIGDKTDFKNQYLKDVVILPIIS